VGWAAVNAVQAVALVIWTAAWISLVLVIRFFGARPETMLTIARRGWAPAVLRCAGVRLLVKGQRHVDASRPCIFMMNHQSLIDVPSVIVALPLPLRFVVKSELSRLPLLRRYLSSTGMVSMDRAMTRFPVSLLRRTAATIRQGSHLLIFPEGTRSRDGSLLPFQRGLFSIAFRAGVPIVPIAIQGASRVLPPGGFRVRPGTIRLRVGEPILPDASSRRSKEKIIRKVREALETMLREMGS
jgi:1-acyl-sn-glycerol-3-phosphate acyltransferase